jgi:hypothetical protein
MSQNDQLTIVTPVFEDRPAAQMLFDELAARYGRSCFVVAVDDGSLGAPISSQNLKQSGLSGVVIRLRRNVGHQRAIAVGLNYVAEFRPKSRCVVMDSDGEDRVSAIKELTDRLDDKDVDVVVAKRKSRVASATFRLFYLMYMQFFRLMTGHQINFGNFMALSPAAVKRLVSMEEVWTHTAASVLVSRLRIAISDIARAPRYAGQSQMNFASLTLHGLKAFMVFAEQVLVRVGTACALIAVLSVFGIVTSIVLKFVGLATPGWFSISLGIMVLVLLQTGALTLMSLMMTGILRGRNLVTVEYRVLIEEIQESDA